MPRQPSPKTQGPANYLGPPFLFTGDDINKTVLRAVWGWRRTNWRWAADAARTVQSADSGRTDEPPGYKRRAKPLTDMLSAYDGTLLVVSHEPLSC